VLINDLQEKGWLLWKFVIHVSEYVWAFDSKLWLEVGVFQIGGGDRGEVQYRVRFETD
tara:strand:- start:167 stop:340 length:174 start_codon:yes stop_codon:yes gene_type:complete